MKIDPNTLDIDVLRPIFQGFESAGHRLYYVGGCVRNAIMGMPATDIDLATDAVPDTVRAIGEALDLKVVATGEAHGTLTFVIDGNGYEITTFRKDISTDGRRATIAHSTSLQDDAQRRDFTMNAIYADQNGQVIDPLQGWQDTVNRKVKFIGAPSDRIREDYLRILRFFRFFAWYGNPQLGIDAAGLAACAAHQDGLSAVSKERIGAEVIKTLSAPNPTPAMASMQSTGILSQILPGARAEPLSILAHLDGDLPISPWRRLAAMGGEDFQSHLRLSNSNTKTVTQIAYHARQGSPALEIGYHLGADLGWDTWLVRCALMEMEPMPADKSNLQKGADALFPITSKDLLPAVSGKELGIALKRAEAFWLKNEVRPSRRDILDYLNLG